MDSLSTCSEIAAVRTAFIRAWQAGKRPRIEDFLPGDERLRDLFIKELVVLEVRERLAAGESPAIADYTARFPDQAEWLTCNLPGLLESSPWLASTTPHGPHTPNTEGNSQARISSPDGTGLASPPLFVGRYRLDTLLGTGGFGEVWRGFDPQLRRVVAIKLPRFDRPLRPASHDQFLAEARKVAALDVPGIVPVYDVGCEGDRYFIVSRYLDSGSLAQVLKQRSFMPLEAARLIADVADALHQAHLQNIFHRDIKPENILLDHQGVPYLADFGVAVTEEEQLAEPRGRVGTYAYMSPEQIQGHGYRLDPRSDIYSLGVVFYRLLAGRLPFLAHTANEYAEQIVHREPRPPRTIKEGIPAELERICLKCLAKSVTERYSTAADLAAELRAFTDPPQRPRPERRWRLVLMVAGVTALLTFAAYGYFTQLETTPPVEAVFPPSWRARLGQDPTELIWPGYRGVGSLGYDQEVRAFRMTSDYPRLIQLGNLSANSFTVSVGIRQTVWKGAAGIFLGYNVITPNGRPPTAQFQYLALAKKTETNGRVVLVLRRTVMRINPQNGTLSAEKELGFHKVNWPQSGVIPRLELHVEPQGLVSARWGGQELSGVTGKLANGKLTGKNYCTGPWGIINQYETTWFQDPAVIVHPRKETSP